MLELASLMKNISNKRREEIDENLLPLRDLILKWINLEIQEAANKGHTQCLYKWPNEDAEFKCLRLVSQVLENYGYSFNRLDQDGMLAIQWFMPKK